MNEDGAVVVSHEDLLRAIEASQFMGLPRTYHFQSPKDFPSVRRVLTVGKVGIIASYIVRENNLAFWIADHVGELGESQIFWCGDKPDHIVLSEELVEFAATRLIEHLMTEFEED